MSGKPDGRSAALRAEKFPGALSPWFCRGRAPFIFLCLLGFPGPNHLRMARLVHGNLPLGFSVLLLRRSAHSGRMVAYSYPIPSTSGLPVITGASAATAYGATRFRLTLKSSPSDGQIAFAFA